jgi:MoaA/NifB/PqqE/SkfB family radical SAM enzyme
VNGAACPTASLGGAEFLDRLARRTGAGPAFPLAGSVELTQRCNLRCRHCYGQNSHPATDALPTTELKHLLGRLADHGVLFLALTGGEPLLHPDFADIYLHAKRRGFLLTVMTNAVLVDAPLADLLATRLPRRIEVTVYGCTADVYEQVTGVPGSFERFRRGVDLLLARDLPVHLKMMVLRSNGAQFEAVQTWASERGCPFRYDVLVNPALDGAPDALAERLPADEVARWLMATPEACDEFVRLRARALAQSPEARLFTCGAGLRTFHVDAGGLLHPCLMWRANPFDPRVSNLEGDWHTHIAALRTAVKPPDSRCAECADRLSCGCCPAISRLETGVAGMPEPYYCAIQAACDPRGLAPRVNVNDPIQNRLGHSPTTG